MGGILQVKRLQFQIKLRTRGYVKSASRGDRDDDDNAFEDEGTEKEDEEEEEEHDDTE
jgi:hypothetical protein